MKHYKLLFCFLSCTAIIDAVNGFYITINPNSNITPGQLFRIIFIFILVYYILRFKLGEKEALFLGFCSFYLLINTIVTTFYHGSIGVLIADLTLVTKLLLPILIILVFKRLSEIEPLEIEMVDKIIENNLVFLTISLLILKFLNLGQEAYLGEVGFKGYYNSNNELSIVLGIMFVYSLHKLLYNRSLKYLLYLLLVISASILIGAKTSYIIIAFTCLIYFFREVRRKRIISLFKFIPAILILVFIVFKGFSENIAKIFEKQIYHYDNSESIMAFMLSNRNILWENIWNTYIEQNINIGTILFGFRKVITPIGTSFINIELDFHALFINYGLIGILFIIPFFIWILVNGRRLVENSFYSYRLSVIIILLFSIFAGHVFFGVFANTFLAIICLPFVSKISSKFGQS